MMNIGDQIKELRDKIDLVNTEITNATELIKSKKEEIKVLERTAKQLEEAKAKIDAIYGNVVMPEEPTMPELKDTDIPTCEDATEL